MSEVRGHSVMETRADIEQQNFSLLPSHSSFVNGCDCSIVIKTINWEMDVPYSDETIREAVSLLEEEAAIEGEW